MLQPAGPLVAGRRLDWSPGGGRPLGKRFGAVVQVLLLLVLVLPEEPVPAAAAWAMAMLAAISGLSRLVTR